MEKPKLFLLERESLVYVSLVAIGAVVNCERRINRPGGWGVKTLILLTLLIVTFGFVSLLICSSFDWPLKRTIGLTLLFIICDEWATERWMKEQK